MSDLHPNETILHFLMYNRVCCSCSKVQCMPILYVHVKKPYRENFESRNIGRKFLCWTEMGEFVRMQWKPMKIDFPSETRDSWGTLPRSLSPWQLIKAQQGTNESEERWIHPCEKKKRETRMSAGEQRCGGAESNLLHVVFFDISA